MASPIIRNVTAVEKSYCRRSRISDGISSPFRELGWASQTSLSGTLVLASRIRVEPSSERTGSKAPVRQVKRSQLRFDAVDVYRVAV
jgi:hypothetical protein